MPYRVRIKVCGITRREDAVAAVNEGVDALGLVFHPASPRHVSVATAADIAQQIPAFVSVVALFVDADRALVEQVIQQVRPDILQFHGDEEAPWCNSFERPYIKALRVRDAVELSRQAARYPAAKALLLDSFKAGVPGGTGETFDWNLIPEGLRTSSVLAGGLNADNVTAAVRLLRPYAVDVSGGVELRKGIKDAAKIRRFVQQVQSAVEST
jgi:phosphoribosylanthranilate isomerase